MKRRTFLASGLAVGIAGCYDRTDSQDRNDSSGTNPDIDYDCHVDAGDHTYTLEPSESASGRFQVTATESGEFLAKVMTDDDTDTIEVTINA